MSARRNQSDPERWREPPFQWRVEPDGSYTPVGAASDLPKDERRHQAAGLRAWELFDKGDPEGERELIRLGVFPEPEPA